MKELNPLIIEEQKKASKTPVSKVTIQLVKYPVLDSEDMLSWGLYNWKRFYLANKPICLCEAAWDAKTNVIASQEATIKTEGSYACKLIIAAGFATGLIATEQVLVCDLREYTGIKFDIRANANIADGVLQFMIDNTSDCTTPIQTIEIGALTADTYKTVSIDFTDPALLGAVTTLGLNAVTDPGAVTLYIDNIIAYHDSANTLTINPGTHCLAIPTDGSLNRFRLDKTNKKVYHQRITSPNEDSNFETTWTELAANIYLDIDYVLACAQYEATIYCIYRNYSGGFHRAVYKKSTDNGATWGSETLFTALVNARLFTACCFGSANNVAFIYTDDTYTPLSLYKTTDGGSTFNVYTLSSSYKIYGAAMYYDGDINIVALFMDSEGQLKLGRVIFGLGYKIEVNTFSNVRILPFGQVSIEYWEQIWNFIGKLDPESKYTWEGLYGDPYYEEMNLKSAISRYLQGGNYEPYTPTDMQKFWYAMEKNKDTMYKGPFGWGVK